MPKRLNLVGQKFGRLTVISINEEKTKEKGKAYWNCKCECGNICCVTAWNLISNHTKSCGCLQCERRSSGNIKHGFGHTRLYGIWDGIKSRCNNTNDCRYEDYGGRGITLCEEWANDFMAFNNWAISNGYNENLTIDRIDVNGNYEPTNCRWANKKMQANNRRNNIVISIDGLSNTLMQWYNIIKPNICYNQILRRYHKEGFISVEQLFGDRRAA